MNRRIPKLGALSLVIATAIAVALFIYLMGQFGGPALRFSSVYTVTATFPDTKELSVRADVDVRGVKVGEVQSINLNRASANVTFAVDSRYAPIYRDATVQIGEKTLLGEAFVVLDPGHRAAGALRRGAHLPASGVLPATVEIDQALNALSPPARENMISTLETAASGAASSQAPDEVSGTLAQLAATTSQLRQLTTLLHGQEGDIAGGMEAAQTVLSQLGERQAAVQEIVSGGRATLQALASRQAALQAGLAALPPLLQTATATLRDARPLLHDAGPLMSELRSAAPPLNSALRVLPPVTADANTVVARLPAFNAVALPTLSLAHLVLDLAQPVSVTLPPALRNLVTVVRFLAAHRRELAAWFSNTADLGSGRDSKGYFARFFINFDFPTAFGIKSSLPSNPYTLPGDEAHNQPYSGYPHLMPYMPPAPKTR
jgi:phospholipid/cholesterol/gamma-HCH transport system substrate-binding protein